MHVQDLTDFVLLRELARRYPPTPAPQSTEYLIPGFQQTIVPVGRDNHVTVTFDPEGLDIVLHPIPASER